MKNLSGPPPKILALGYFQGLVETVVRAEHDVEHSPGLWGITHQGCRSTPSKDVFHIDLVVTVALDDLGHAGRLLWLFHKAINRIISGIPFRK